jgi:KDO2-lipid IV(A) lauroyltransferase
MVPRPNIVKDMGRLFFWYPIRWLVRLVPIYYIYWVGGILGDLDYLVSGSGRINKMAKNLSLVFGSDTKELKKIVRKNLQNHGRNVLEFIKYPQLNSKNMGRFLSFENLEYLEKEISKQKGVILATAHIGAKQLILVGLGLKGYKLNQMNYHMNASELSYVQKNISQRHRKKIEKSIPADFISSNQFLRPAMNCLKENQILVVAADGIGLRAHMNSGYSAFSFFGNQVLFPSKVISLARRTGSPIVPTFVIRNKRRHRIIFEPAIEMGAESDQDVFRGYIKILEKYIGQYPHLWEFWEEFEEGTMMVKSQKQCDSVAAESNNAFSSSG